MRQLITRFIIRWLVCSLGLWVAAGLLGNHVSFSGTYGAVIGAGFILAAINMLLKPLLIFLSLPAIILSLGIFMLVVNGFMVYLTSLLYSPLHVTSFWAAIFAGIIIGLVNYLLTAILEEKS